MNTTTRQDNAIFEWRFSITRPYPGSIVSCAMDAQGTAGRWISIVMLVNLGWLFFSPLMGGENLSQWLAATLVTLPFFLYAYLLAFFGPARGALICTAVIVVLAFGLAPINLGSLAYLIFSFFPIAHRLPLQRAMLLIAVLLVAYLAVAWSIIGVWQPVAILATPGVIVGLIALFNGHAQQRRMQLHHAQNEVRRLAVVAERERIARDLHDLLGHTLSVVALKSELAGRMVERDPQAAVAEIAQVTRVAREALAQVREAVTGIRAAGIAAEISVGRVLLDAREIELEEQIEPVTLSGEIETTLALVIREAVVNIERHASGRHARISLARENDNIALTIANDGVRTQISAGNGITGMRERVAALGGTFTVERDRDWLQLRALLPTEASGVA
jgi:two-component system, NarL family, sensor histidine kinase DesK